MPVETCGTRDERPSLKKESEQMEKVLRSKAEPARWTTAAVRFSTQVIGRQGEKRVTSVAREEASPGKLCCHRPWRGGIFDWTSPRGKLEARTSRRTHASMPWPR